MNKIRIDLLTRLFPEPEYKDFIEKEGIEFLNISYIARDREIFEIDKRMIIVNTMKDWTYAKILIYLQLILKNPNKNIIDHFLFYFL